jgi:glutamate dehydrogenase (NADP+)
MFGQYKRISNEFTGVLTGKGLTYGGSLVRTEATGYGLCYFADEMFKANGKSFKGKTVVISGSGNVAIYATEKATELGGKVVALSDSNGYIYDPDGIDLACVKQLKEVERKRIKEYIIHTRRQNIPTAQPVFGQYHAISHCPARLKTRLTRKVPKSLLRTAAGRLPKAPTCPPLPKQLRFILKRCPLWSRQAANAGGVATSGLEMSQNSMRISWSFEEVDNRLKVIMADIFKSCEKAAKEYGMDGNIYGGRKYSGFLRVAEAMKAQGCV